MSDDSEFDARANMNELMSRAHRHEANAEELRELLAWRRASPEHEQEYRQTTRLLEVASTLPHAFGMHAPSAAQLLASRDGIPRAAWGRTIARLVPWSIAAAAAIAFTIQWKSRVVASTWGLANVVTGAAEMTTLTLQDGSVVRLAPASQLKFIVSDTAREVKLEGRAFFAVAPLKGKSFVVHTDGGDARVLGTRFEIATDQRDLRLVVVEGRVALSNGSKRVEVVGGEASGIRNAVMLDPVRVSNAERMNEWVGKFMVFRATPMRDVALQIERVYGVPVKIDSVVAGRTVNATFTDRTVEEVLDVICSATHAQCKRQSGGIFISAKP